MLNACTQFTDRECRKEDCCMDKICQKCKKIGEDHRTLWMSCFYDMNELDIPFQQEKVIAECCGKTSHEFYTLSVCKTCRADWMALIKLWWKTDPGNESPGTGIYIRELGKTIEITEEEWKRRSQNIEPVRFKKDD